MQKFVNIALIALGAISLLFCFLLVRNIDPWMDIMLYFSYVLTIITVLLAVFFALKILVTYPKKLKRALMVAIGALVIVVVSYLISGKGATSGASESLTRWVSTAIIVFYILAILSAALLAFYGIRKSLKNR